MKITDIIKHSKTKYKVYIDNEYFYILDVEIISANKLKIGSDYDEEFLLNLKYQAEKRKSREYALYLITNRDYSKSDLIKKLSKNASEEVAYEVADRMQELGLINDKEFSKKFAKELILKKKYGYNKVKYEMEKKGLDIDLIEEGISSISFDNLSLIKGIIDKKYKRYIYDKKGINKIINSLFVRGFEYSDIKSVIDSYYEEC